jgi:catechol 2,3-dioxygenase-like lactoylglutathione lyase family enzyme
MKIEGIHHVTCITGDAPGNVDFYVHVLGLRMVKKSVKQQGKSESTAEEIAARTVNKERARSGESRTRSKTSTRDPKSSSQRGGERSGTNKPKGRTRDQLYSEAQKLNIEGRSSMNKQQLQRAVDRKKS